MLEDGEVAGAGGHEVEPLPGSGGLVRGGKDGEGARGRGGMVDVHDDEIDKVDRRRFVKDLLHGNAVQARVIAVTEPEHRERHAAALTVPVAHGEGSDRLDKPKDAIRLE